MKLLGPVQNRFDGSDLIGCHRLTEGVDDRHPACDRSFKGDAATGLTGGLEQLAPVFTQQGLVGGDDVLARPEGGQHDLAGRIEAAHQLDDDINIRSFGDRQWVGCQSGGGQVNARDRDRSRTAPRVTRMSRPERSVMRAACSCRMRATLAPTVPSPTIPTRKASIGLPVCVTSRRSDRVKSKAVNPRLSALPDSSEAEI